MSGCEFPKSSSIFHGPLPGMSYVPKKACVEEPTKVEPPPAPVVTLEPSSFPKFGYGDAGLPKLKPSDFLAKPSAPEDAAAGGVPAEKNGVPRRVVFSPAPALDEITSKKPMHFGHKDGADGGVSAMQTELNAWLTANGRGAIKVDGRFGKETVAAVKAFQRENGLKADGKIGPETLAKLTAKQPTVEQEAASALGEPSKPLKTDNSTVQFPKGTEFGPQLDL